MRFERGILEFAMFVPYSNGGHSVIEVTVWVSKDGDIRSSIMSDLKSHYAPDDWSERQAAINEEFGRMLDLFLPVNGSTV